MDEHPVQNITLRWIARDGSVVTLDIEQVTFVDEAKDLVVIQGVARVVDGRRRELSVAELSPRELDVLRLAAGDRTHEQIAETLCISRRTVEHHLAHIRAKMGTSSTKAAVVVAIQDGLRVTKADGAST